MRYEVRYLIDDTEQTDLVDVENAAEAAARVQEQHLGPDTRFELIQVQLLDEHPAGETIGEPAGAVD